MAAAETAEAPKYKDGQIIPKEVTDKQGQREAVIPKWMQKDAPIPEHVKQLQCEKIELPFNYCKDGRWCVRIKDVLTKAECDELIKFSEEQGYEDALVNIGYGRQQKMPEFRNCKRMMIDSVEMATCLWNRVQQFIPTYFNDRRKIEFNERLRFLRYNKKEFFAPHFDGVYRRPTGELSQITLLLYLNNDFKGARTNFIDMDDDQCYHAPVITPGMMILFQHDMFHEGAVLEEGCKYIMRSDVMFTKKKYSAKRQAEDKENVAIPYVKYEGLVVQKFGQEQQENDEQQNGKDDEESKQDEEDNDK
mmetsp:Transcript_37381/g.59864  ORF Transcript_37381/g.59864 Transcript_37381/m.59864 type:complete len:305 (+) Transcript_37381:27-941(+)